MKTFRSKLTQWLMLGFLVLAVVAIVVTGFGTGGTGGLPGGGANQQGGETLVEIGDQALKASDVDDALRRRLREIQQQNPEVEMSQLLAAGAYDAALDQLVTRLAIWEYGRSKGLTVSDQMIDRVIVGIPAFHNLAGQFDNNAFRQRIQELGLSEAQLRREIAYDLMERQLQAPLGRNVAPPEPIAVQYASLLLERRRGLIGVVPNEAVAAGINPTDAQIAAHFQQNRARYTVPERRVLRYALISRDQAAAGARATDQEIAAYYEQNRARYAGTETRTIQQIILRDEAQARTFLQRAGAGGANFVAAAQQAGRAPGDVNLGAQSREQFTNITNPQIANQTFSAAPGAVIGPVRSPLGWHVIRVEAVNAAQARPLQAVRGEIVTAIEQRKAEEAIANAVGRVEERIAQGQSFEEVARAERLTVVETPPVTAAGAAPGVQWQAPPEIPAIVRGAFQVDPEDPEPTIETLTPNERFALVAVARVLPAAVPPLAQIRERVRMDLVQQEASQRARALADRIVAAINRGTAPAQAFAQAGVRLPAPQPVDEKRIDVARRGQVPPPLAALFSLPPGRARVVPAGNGVYVVTVTERVAGQATCPAGQPPAAAQASEGCQAITGMRADLQAQLGGEVAEQLARAARNAIEIRRNEDAIRRARQALEASR